MSEKTKLANLVSTPRKCDECGRISVLASRKHPKFVLELDVDVLDLISNKIEGMENELNAPALAQAYATMPDPTITPGSVRSTDTAEICSSGRRELRHWSRARDDYILQEYGLPAGPHPQFEIDHLVPLGIGGADDDKNLWAEPRRSIEPVWNVERKDDLEWRLRELVCSRGLDVHEAQKAINEDWTVAYKRFIAAQRDN